MSAPEPEASGLREVLLSSLLDEYGGERADWTEMRSLTRVVEALKPFLAAPEADRATAGEREVGGFRSARPADCACPPLARHLPGCPPATNPATPPADNASSDASEPLTEDFLRDLVTDCEASTSGGHIGTALIPWLATVLAAREAKARAEERERIAQAIENEAMLRPKPSFNYTADYRDGLRGAARIARSQS